MKVLTLVLVIYQALSVPTVDKPGCIYQASKIDYFNYANLAQSQADQKIEYTSSSGETFTIDFKLWEYTQNTCKNIPSMAILYPTHTVDYEQECKNLHSAEIQEWV